MNEVQYVGEHLWVGQLGQIAIVIAFVSSIISLLGYSIYTNKNQPLDTSWKSVGRWSYIIHIITITLVIGLVFFAMINQYYEYAYAYQHVSSDLPMRYIVSAFWEGQEGSFLLWMIWHLVLGAIFIRKGGFWESPVMAMIALAEVFLSSMILGVYVELGDFITKFGSSPLSLLRDTMEAPIFANAEYLSLISGTGLNPLLQNYWMTIHPPVTFLGFASTTVPFAFAVAGLWTGKYKEWLTPALPWCLFSGFILGTGILMGSVWAYEALSFGGYWSWDPVENAVLVPWLTLIAGIHTHLVAKKTGYSIRPTVFFYIITLVLMIYSTYLTRSGILGDTSAHAFTKMGLENQLIAFLAVFLGLGLYFMIRHRKHIPTKKKEESIYSREFWMFVGSLVLLFSGILILVSTSLPVYNKIRAFFEPGFVGNVINDPVPHYNRYQLWIAVFISMISSMTVYLRYGEALWSSRSKMVMKHMAISICLAAIATFLFSKVMHLYNWQYTLLCFMGFFSIMAHINYLFSILRGKFKLASSAIAHLGFGMMLVGLLASGVNKSTISSSPFIFKNVFNDEDVNKYIQLIKNKPFFAQGYWMTYESDTLVDRLRYYTIDFKKTGTSDGEVIDQFKLRPNANYSNDFSKVAAFNPDTKHYIFKDIFSCIVSLAPTKQDVETAQKFEDSLTYTIYEAYIGDTVQTKSNYFVIKGLNFAPKHKEYNLEENDLGIGLDVEMWNDRVEDHYQTTTALGLQGNLVYKYPYIEEDLGIRIRPADQLMDRVFTPEHELKYEKYVLKTYGDIDFHGRKISIKGFDKDPENPSYTPEEGDIAVGAEMLVSMGNQTYTAKPIYLIRKNVPQGAKAYIPEAGLHIRFTGIDPKKEEFTFLVAQDNVQHPIKIPIEIAENIPRTDYIILQANIFPGINFFWLGSTLMMIGLLMAMIVSIYQKKRT